MWSYRDWVIQALNHNMPFDRFTIEQLAGDLLPNRTLEQQIASGFNRCNITTNEGGAIEEEYRVLYTRDRTETTSQVWLGLTAGCAVCHDHKFDPICTARVLRWPPSSITPPNPAMDGNVKDTPPIQFRAPEDLAGGRLPRAYDQFGGNPSLTARAKRAARAADSISGWRRLPADGVVARMPSEGWAPIVPERRLWRTVNMTDGKNARRPRPACRRWDGHVAAQSLQEHGRGRLGSRRGGRFRERSTLLHAVWVKLTQEPGPGHRRPHGRPARLSRLGHLGREGKFDRILSTPGRTTPIKVVDATAQSGRVESRPVELQRVGQGRGS